MPLFLASSRGLYISGQAQRSTQPPLGDLRIPPDPREVVLLGTVRLRSAICHVPKPSLCPFFIHFCCVAERWTDIRVDDRAPRPIANASGATASANERTS